MTRRVRELKANSERQIWKDDQRTVVKTQRKKAKTLEGGSRFFTFSP